MTIVEDVPLFAFAVALMVIDSGVVPRVEIENVPLASVFVTSPNVPSPLLSNCACPVLLDIVTTVELSGTVTPMMSFAVTLVLNAMPVRCGEVAETL